MTAKDYKLIAATINLLELSPDDKLNVAYALAELFEDNYHRFDFMRFVRACLKAQPPVDLDALANQIYGVYEGDKANE